MADGREVIQALERQDYDPVLMDVRDGGEGRHTAAQAMRNLRPKKGPRIVAITAYALKGGREKCLEAGMDDYTTKPVVAG